MLSDDCPAVDAHDFPVRKGQGNGVHSLCVQVWLVVCRHQNSAVDDQIVSVSGRKTVIWLLDVVNGTWQRQSEKPVRVSFDGAQCL